MSTPAATHTQPTPTAAEFAAADEIRRCLELDGRKWTDKARDDWARIIAERRPIRDDEIAQLHESVRAIGDLWEEKLHIVEAERDALRQTWALQEEIDAARNDLAELVEHHAQHHQGNESIRADAAVRDRDAARENIAEARHILKCPQAMTLSDWCQRVADDLAASETIRANAAERDRDAACADAEQWIRLCELVLAYLEDSAYHTAQDRLFTALAERKAVTP